jgi:hypothetical protein
MMKYYRPSLVLITFLGMQGCWLYTALQAANQAVRNRLAVPLLLLTLVLSMVVALLLKRLPWPRPVLAALSWIIWPLVMLGMIKVQLYPGLALTDSAWLVALPHALARLLFEIQAPLLILICTAILWFLGRRLAYLKPDFAAALVELQVGLVALGVIFLVVYQLNLEHSSLGATAVIFFLLALMGLAAAHSQDQGWLFSSHQGRWMGIILACIGTIILIGLLAAWIFTPGLMQWLINILKWIWGVVLQILGFLVSLIHFSDSPVPEAVPQPTMPAVDPEHYRLWTLPEGLRNALRIGWSAFMIGLFLFMTWKIVSQISDWLRRRSPSGKDTLEPLRGAFKDDLLNWLKKLLRLIFRLKTESAKDSNTPHLAPQAISIRRLYAQLLGWAAAQGYPRAESQTPQEFLAGLTAVRPEIREGLESITAEYEKVRYGSGVPTDEQVDRLKALWPAIKKSGWPKKGGTGRS